MDAEIQIENETWVLNRGKSYNRKTFPGDTGGTPLSEIFKQSVDYFQTGNLLSRNKVARNNAIIITWYHVLYEYDMTMVWPSVFEVHFIHL